LAFFHGLRLSFGGLRFDLMEMMIPPKTLALDSQVSVLYTTSLEGRKEGCTAQDLNSSKEEEQINKF